MSQRASASRQETVRALLELHPRSHVEKAGIRVENKPAPLFRLLCAALLFSARISADIAIAATRALAEAGWTTPRKLAASSWQDRARVLNRSGYARYDERTASMLGETTDRLLNRYDGDLRRLRDEAGRDPQRERALLTGFKGIGDVGADIFCREAQSVWPELRPFADERALEAAGRLDLPRDPRQLAKLVRPQDFPRLLSALVWVGAEDAYDRVRQRTAGDGEPGEPAGPPRREATKKELYDQARQLGIPGRSSMRKDELAQAVQAASR